METGRGDEYACAWALIYAVETDGAVAKILVTGAGGFIGYHVSRALAARGDEVVGVDNLNDYYDVGLKKARLAELESQRLRGHFTRAEQTRQALAANPEAHYSIEELSIAEAYDELPDDVRRRLAKGDRGHVT